MLEAAKTGPVTLEVAAARALRRLLANARGPPVRAANILHIVVEVKAVFPTRRRARWNSMAVDGARFRVQEVQSPPSVASRRRCSPRARSCRASLEASRRARQAAPIACRRSQCPVESAACECRMSILTRHGCIKVHCIGPVRRGSSCNHHRPLSSMSKHVLEHAEGARSTQCSSLFACRTS